MKSTRTLLIVACIIAAVAIVGWRLRHNGAKPAARTDSQATTTQPVDHGKAKSPKSPDSTIMSRSNGAARTSGVGDAQRDKTPSPEPPVDTMASADVHSTGPAKASDEPPATAPDGASATAMQTFGSFGGGTAGMVAAHDPLRQPEVADPDSQTNKRILQTMLAKAVNRANGVTAGNNNPQ